MKSKKLLVCLALASALTLSQAVTALAAGSTTGGVSPNMDAEREANGHTTISIMQTKATAPQNISFTVPLYVTMAVVGNDTEVKTPTNYSIENTTTPGASDAEKQLQNIGITGMSFERLGSASFNTVATAPQAASMPDKDNIQLSIGGMIMPALSSATIAKVTLGGDVVNSGTTDPKPIKVEGPEKILNLPIIGKVTDVDRGEAPAVAQFRVRYTLSPLSSAGEPLGSVYAGDDRNAAGLAPFVPTN